MKIILTILISSTLTRVTGQTNLVPNPSFENHSIIGCPTSVGTGQSLIVDNWNTLYNTPDYFNTCATSTLVTVPQNLLGFAYPSSGNAYAGLWTYQSTTASYHEIIGAQLISPLVIGQKYYIKFMLRLTLGYNSNSGTDKTGIRFTTIQHTTSNPPALNNLAHIYTSSVITDTMNWTNVFGSFIADSTYSFIEVGNLFDNSHTNIQVVWPDGGSNWSYYYIDDVCISTDSIYSANWYWTGIDNHLKNNSRTNIYPNPTSDQSTLQFDNTKKEICTLTLYDLRGQIMRTINNITSDQVVIQKNDLTKGLYYFVLRTSDRVIVTGKLAVD